MCSVFVAHKVESESTWNTYLITQQSCARNYFAIFCSRLFRRYILIRYPYSQSANRLLEKAGRERVVHYDAGNAKLEQKKAP